MTTDKTPPPNVQKKRRTVTVEGTEYLLTGAGGLILACPKCGEEHFREPHLYFGYTPEEQAFETCFSCPGSVMEPIKVAELENRWKPFWFALGHEVFNEDGTLWAPSTE